MIYKEDWEKELKVNQLARDQHLKGHELLSELCVFFEEKVKMAEEKPVEKPEEEKSE